MKKRAIALLTLLLAVLLAAVIYVLVSRKPPEEEPVSETVALMPFVPAKAVALSWRGEAGEYALEKTDDGWIWVDHPDCPLDPEKVSGLLTKLSYLTGEKTLMPQEGENYGLEPAAMEASVTLIDGKVLQLFLGDYSAYAGGYYAGSSERTDLVILPEEDAAPLETTEWDLLRYDSLPEAGTVTAVSLKNADADFSARWLEKGPESWYSPRDHWFMGEEPLSESAVEELLAGLTMSPFQRCVSYDRRDPLWEESGVLAPDAVRVELQSGKEGTGASVTLLFGSYVDYSCYAAVEGGQLLYLVNGALADKVIHLDPADYRSVELCRLEKEDVSTLEIRIGENSRRFDGVPEEAEPFFSALTELTTLRIARGETGRGEQLELTLTLTTGRAVQIRFALYGTQETLAQRDGDAFLLDRMEADAVIELAETLLRGE